MHKITLLHASSALAAEGEVVFLNASQAKRQGGGRNTFERVAGQEVMLCSTDESSPLPSG